MKKIIVLLGLLSICLVGCSKVDDVTKNTTESVTTKNNEESSSLEDITLIEEVHNVELGVESRYHPEFEFTYKRVGSKELGYITVPDFYVQYNDPQSPVTGKVVRYRDEKKYNMIVQDNIVTWGILENINANAEQVLKKMVSRISQQYSEGMTREVYHTFKAKTFGYTIYQYRGFVKTEKDNRKGVIVNVFEYEGKLRYMIIEGLSVLRSGLFWEIMESYSTTK